MISDAVPLVDREREFAQYIARERKRRNAPEPSRCNPASYVNYGHTSVGNYPGDEVNLSRTILQAVEKVTVRVSYGGWEGGVTRLDGDVVLQERRFPAARPDGSGAPKETATCGLNCLDL